MELDAEADHRGADTEGLRRDVLYLRRLEWDLGELRDVVRGAPRKKALSRLDPANFPKGPRP